MAQRLVQITIVAACCLSCVRGDRTEATRRAASRRIVSEFQDMGDIPLSRLQMEQEVVPAGSSLVETTSGVSAMSCSELQAMQSETQRLKTLLLNRMTEAHGVVSATSLNKALSGKGGGDTKCDADTKQEINSEKERTKKMYSLSAKELLKYWLPQDCHTILEEQKAMMDIEAEQKKNPKEQNVPAAKTSGDNPEADQEEATLEKDCDAMARLLYRAAQYVKRVKKIVEADDDKTKKKAKAEKEKQKEKKDEGGKDDKDKGKTKPEDNKGDKDNKDNKGVQDNKDNKGDTDNKDKDNKGDNDNKDKDNKGKAQEQNQGANTQSDAEPKQTSKPTNDGGAAKEEEPKQDAKPKAALLQDPKMEAKPNVALLQETTDEVMSDEEAERIVAEAARISLGRHAGKATVQIDSQGRTEVRPHSDTN
mmetsp:Transcript_92144/g.201966  ORF Transcript_92144/g.201966 Transcript_92144/m.201966 type:complete len:421 (+) Transcript_92144:152-1414(+)|eukprot:CAMPEP_0206433168 /NCGR_PEP_ID=MMETSP0324_2-20121206/8372_1 /ASSEMBLY_ACC=CAM_ASM_000836 /TAXON_ID=2866 /ORGANISM="Crypthecodinium cohnii, Strain Seligo" /LENGTH=420 /DNA_ID=CAMNT_0053899381 /DNA_START=107 /DNA_END=1369 /DNA_ORIENTATION=-